MILHGDKDDIVPQVSVDKLVQKLKKQKNIGIDYRVVKGGNHFFQDDVSELISHLNDYLDKSLPKAA